MLRTSSRGLDLIKRFEDEAGFLAGACTRLTAYRCSAGVWTIGWGHTRGVESTTTCTPLQADAWLQEDVVDAESLIHRRVIVPLSQSQFDALVSFVFNMRNPHRNFTEGNCTLLRLLNACSPPPVVAAQFSRWVNALDPVTGKKSPLPGLVRRREAERLLFLEGQDNQSSQQPQSSQEGKE